MKAIHLMAGIGILMLSSCVHQPIIHPNPEIDIDLPVSSSIYHNGDTIHVELVMRDHAELHEGFIYIRTTTDTLLQYAPLVHELDSFVVDTYYVVSGVSSGVDGFVTAIATNHHNGETVMNVPFFMVP